jgi:hypothetical protein
MAKVVLIFDDATGRMIDCKGADKESGRYAKMAARMLSVGNTPTLDFGKAGGDTLNVCANGRNGAEIKLMANKVSVTGRLAVGDKDIPDADDIATNSGIAGTAQGIQFSSEDTIPQMAVKLNALMDRIRALGGVS